MTIPHARHRAGATVRSRVRRSRLRQSELRLFLLLGDAGAAAAAAWGAPELWSAFDPGYVPTPGLALWQAAFAAGWVLVLWLFGGGEIARPRFGRRSLAAMGQTLLTVAAVVLILFYVAPFFAPRGSTFLSLPLTAVAILAWRAGYLRLLSARVFDRRVAVLGTDQAARGVTAAILASSGMPYRLVATLSAGPVEPLPIGAIPAIRVNGDLWERIRELDVDQIVVGHTRTLPQETLAELVRCFEHGVEAVPATRVYEQLTGRVLASALEADWYAELPTFARGPYAIVKRTVDLGLCCVLGALALPVAALVTLAILVGSGRPVVLRQIRVGQWGEPFVLHKFRTMRLDAEPNGRPIWASANDGRATRVGRLLRRTRLDELPQLWDVLRGKMSLIGPRPERPEFVERLAAELPLYRARSVVRPGITGWAQVQFPYAGSVEDSLAKLEYDLYYIRHLGPILDASIALRTVVSVLRSPGS